MYKRQRSYGALLKAQRANGAGPRGPALSLVPVAGNGKAGPGMALRRMAACNRSRSVNAPSPLQQQVVLGSAA